MKKTNLIFIGFLFFVSFISTMEAQSVVFFYENCGNSAPSTNPRPSPVNYEDWANYGKGHILFSGNTDVRSTTYDDSHIWFAANSVRTFEISGINSSAYKDISLSFRIQSIGANPVDVAACFSVYCIDSNNSVYPVNLPTVLSKMSQWVSVTDLQGIPSIGNFKLVFTSSSGNSDGIRLDDISLSGTEKSGETSIFDFKITTWNTDWLSCQEFDLSPYDVELQMNNVVSVIKAMDSDFVALQEVGTSSTYNTIDTLVRRLGSEWAGDIVALNYSNCSQNQGIIYKKSKLQLVNSSLITNGGSSYNWSNGRYPALYNVNVLVGGTQIPVSFVNIHAKASSDEASYARRKGASTALKSLLDGNAYRNKKLVIIGDFNDYLTGTQCYMCEQQDSPYKNFMDDSDNYQGITKDLLDPWYRTPTVIDNIIISDELFDNYVSYSVENEISATWYNINDYYSTTSSHTPVSATFRFLGLKTGIKNLQRMSDTSIHVYPNSGTGIFTISCKEFSANDKLEIFSITGLPVSVYAVQTSDTVIDLTAFPAGYYIVKIKNKVAKIIKQ